MSISLACAIYLDFVIQSAGDNWRKDLAPLFMAQMTQESACKATARSPFAHGLMQFTLPTASDMEKGICKDLGPAQVYDPKWSVPCGIRYDKFLYDRMGEYSPDVERQAAMLASYNGGRGWVNRDNRVCSKLTWCDPSKWFGNVELTPDPRRAEWAVKENRYYPQVILFKWLPVYDKYLINKGFEQ